MSSQKLTSLNISFVDLFVQGLSSGNSAVEKLCQQTCQSTVIDFPSLSNKWSFLSNVNYWVWCWNTHLVLGTLTRGHEQTMTMLRHLIFLCKSWTNIKNVGEGLGAMLFGRKPGITFGSTTSTHNLQYQIWFSLIASGFWRCSHCWWCVNQGSLNKINLNNMILLRMNCKQWKFWSSFFVIRWN